MLALMPCSNVHAPGTWIDLFLTCVSNPRGKLNSFQAGINKHTETTGSKATAVHTTASLEAGGGPRWASVSPLQNKVAWRSGQIQRVHS